MEPARAIQEFLEYVVAGLVEHPEEASVEHRESAGVHFYRIGSHPEDCGRLVGRGGRTIEAIQGLVSAFAEKHRVRAEVAVERELRE